MRGVNVARPCGACSLPAELRAVVLQQRRNLVPLRDISEQLGHAGYPLSKDALARHFETCVAPSVLAEADTRDTDRLDLAVADAARGALEGWPSIARRLTVRLHRDGLSEAAQRVALAIPETMRPGHPKCLPQYQSQQEN